MKTNFPRTILSLAIAASSLGHALAQSPSQPSDDHVNRLAIPVSDDSERIVEASLMSGSITVLGYEGSEVIVEAVNASFRQKEDAVDEDGLRILRPPLSGLYAEANGNHITLNSRNMGKAIELTIRVPVETSLKLHCMNQGDISVEGVSGVLELENLNGKISVLGAKGSVLANALNQNISVVLDEVENDKPMSFISLNGTIDVTLPDDTKASLKMESFSGSIKTDFDIEIETKQRPPVVQDQRPTGGSYNAQFETALHGSINGGGPQYLFKTHNGDIIIRKGKPTDNSETSE